MAATLVMAMVVAVGCGGGAARSAPRVTVAVVTDDRESKTEKTVFSPDTRTIYVLANIADVPAGTTMKSVWIAENAQGFQPNEKMDEASLTVGGNLTSGVFNFTRNEPWPNGSYRVELYLADKLAHTARFRVEGVSARPEALIPPVGPAPASGPPARLGAILFAKGQSDYDPVEPATQFDEGVRAVYAFFNFADLEANDTVTAVWSKDGNQLLEQKSSLAEIFSGRTPPRRGHFWFSITFPNGARPGTLKVDLTINGTPAQSGSVQIGGSSAPAATPPAATPAGALPFGPIIFARGESNTQPVGRSDRFEQGIKAVYAFFDFQGLKPEDVVAGAWYRDNKKILDQQVKMADIFKDSPREKGHLWFSITFDEGASTGSYKLVLSFNGAPAIEGSFTVE
jgi:hypothetical protein